MSEEKSFKDVPPLKGGMRQAAEEALARKAAEAEAARQTAEREAEAQADLNAPELGAEAATAEAQAEAEAVAGDLAIRESTAITFGSMMPTPTHATLNSLGKERGIETNLGRITGTVFGTERKQTMFGGKLLESVALLGDFYALAPLRNGEIIHGTMLFLTTSYSVQIERALKDSATTGETASIDVEVGFQTTGKQPVSYAWTITHFLAGRPTRALRDLLGPRRTRLNGTAPALLTGGGTGAQG